jgi:hypothetical protein
MKVWPRGPGVLRRAASGGAAGQDGVDLADGLGVHTQDAASGRAGVAGGDAGVYLGVGQVGRTLPTSRYRAVLCVTSFPFLLICLRMGL